MRDKSTLLSLNRIVATYLDQRIDHVVEGVHFVIMQDEKPDLLLSGTGKFTGMGIPVRNISFHCLFKKDCQNKKIINNLYFDC